MSNNLQKIIEYGKDPSCVACISPLFGGAWHSIIRTGDGPQPSTVMRNFAEEEQIYHDLNAWWSKQNPTYDFEFTIYYKNILPDVNSRVFYLNPSTAVSPFSIYKYSTNQVIFFTGFFKTPWDTNSYYPQQITPAGPLDTVWHKVVARVIGNRYILLFDGVVILDRDDLARIAPTINGFMASNSGYVKSVSFRNLTTGSHWSYPSIAEKVRLLTKYNCDTSQLDFRLASTAQNNWCVKTGLSFAGWSRPLTIIGRMYIAPDSGGSDAFDYEANVVHHLIAQGYPAGGTGPGLVLALYYTNRNGINQYHAALTLNTGSGVVMSATPSAPPQGRVVALGVTIDNNTGRWSIYENGALLNSAISSNLVGFSLLTDVSGANNTPVTYLHQLNPYWQNRNDRVDWCMVFDRVLSDAEIKYLSYDREDWVDLSLPVEAGTINITTDSIPELEWTLPDGTKSTASTLNQTVEAGTLRMKCYKYGKTFRINVSTALQNSTIKVKDLPRVTYYLQLYSLPGLTGTVSDLPRVTSTLYLNNLPGLTGNVSDLPRGTTWLYLDALSGLTGTVSDLPRVTSTLYLISLPGLTGTVSDLPRVTSTLYLYNLPGLTGNASDLPLNTGPLRQIFNMSGLAGALSVVSTNINVYYYDNAQVTPAEYDQTVQNIVDAGGVNGTLRISNARTSASDANIATLQSRGWTVTEY